MNVELRISFYVCKYFILYMAVVGLSSFHSFITIMVMVKL